MTTTPTERMIAMLQEKISTLTAECDALRAERARLTAERDAARREILMWVKERCSWVELSKEIERRGWNCFKGEAR